MTSSVLQSHLVLRVLFQENILPPARQMREVSRQAFNGAKSLFCR
ncbi:hypothetical protein [Lignipirellula cremea]|nr:hypothetical protein [Lignipirellula cremea]